MVLSSVLLIGGLLLCGPGHSALHDDSHGMSCDACTVAGLEAPAVLHVEGPVSTLVAILFHAPDPVRTRDASFVGNPRGPPPVA